MGNPIKLVFKESKKSLWMLLHRNVLNTKYTVQNNTWCHSLIPLFSAEFVFLKKSRTAEFISLYTGLRDVERPSEVGGLNIFY